MATSCRALDRSRRLGDLQAVLLRLVPAVAFANADHDVVAAVAQIERVRAALASVAEHGDARSAQGLLIDVFVRIQTHGELRESSQKYQHRISYHARTGALPFRASRRIETHDRRRHAPRFRCGFCTKKKSRRWKSAQAAHVAAWLGEHHFKGEKHRVLLVPDRARRRHARGRGSGQAPGRALALARRRDCPSGCRRAVIGWRRTSAPPRPRSSVSGSPTERIASSAIGAAEARAPRDARAAGECRSRRTSRSPARRSPGRAIGSTRRPATSGPPKLAAAARDARRAPSGAAIANGWARSCSRRTFPPSTRSAGRAPSRRAWRRFAGRRAAAGRDCRASR